MPGRYLGPVQWRPVGENRELLPGMQPSARAALGWLFNQIGDAGSGIRQGIWNVDLGDGKTGIFHALALRDPDGFQRAFVTMSANVPSLEAELQVVFDLLFESGLAKIRNLGDGVFGATLSTGTGIASVWHPTVDLNGDLMPDVFFPQGAFNVTEGTVIPILGDLSHTTGNKGASRNLITQDAMKCVAYAPASLFTGKMRLFAQAVYGCPTADRYVDIYGRTWPEVRLNGRWVKYRGRSTNLLVTTVDYRYFIADLRMGEDTTTCAFYEFAARSTLTVGEQALRTWALDRLRVVYPDDAAKRDIPVKSVLESIVLALSNVNSTAHSSLSVATPSTAYPLGEPLAYGWHSNWDGSEARIVLLAAEPHSMAVAAKTFQATIGHTIEDDTVTFSLDVDLLSESTGAVSKHFYAWTPDGVFELSSYLWLTYQIYVCPSELPSEWEIVGAPSSFDLEIYGYYDVDNVWVSVQWNTEYLSEADPPARPTGGMSIAHGSSSSRYIYGVTGSPGNRIQGVSVGGTVIGSTLTMPKHSTEYQHADISQGPSMSARSDGIYQGYGAYSPCSSTNFPGCGSGCILGNNWYYWYQGAGNSRTEKTDYQAAGDAGIVILHDDCEAVLALYKQSAQTSGLRIGIEEGVSLGTDGRHYYMVRYNKNNNSPGDVRWSGSDIRCDTTNEGGNWFTQTWTETGGSLTETVSVSLCTPHGIATIAEGTTRTGSGSFPLVFAPQVEVSVPDPFGTAGGDDMNDWSLLLEPSAAPCLGLREVSYCPGVRVSAVFGDAIGKGTPGPMASLATGGYTGGTSFIGWA